MQALKLQQRGDLEGSRSMIDDVLESEPTHALAQCCAGFSSALSGDIDGAEKTFEDAVIQ